MIKIMCDWRRIFDTAREVSVASGARIFHRGDPVRSMYLLREGSVALERPMADGTALTLHRAAPGDALAEASVFSDTYHCDAVARAPSRIAALSRAAFLAALERDPGATLSLVRTHARAVQALRARIEILRLRRVADRLDAWLELYGPPGKGGWIGVADAIGVSPPALYRELARRRRAGRAVQAISDI